VSNPISAHELGPFGLAQYLNFLLTGLLIVFFAIGLYQALPPGRLAKATRIVLVVMGFGFSLGVFTLDVGNPHSWHGYLHVAGFFILTLASLVMPFLVAAVFLRGGQVSWLGWLAFAAGIATVIVLFVPQVRGTFPNWFGPASKLHLMITFGFLETVAIWVWISGRRVADEGPKRPGRPST
jgi:drug/metabolite transporter (DMT)-like permease